MQSNGAAAPQRSRNHVLGELGFTVARTGDDQMIGTAPIVPEMWVPGTEVLRSSVLAIWADTVCGLLAVDALGPRVPVTLQLDIDLYRPPAGRLRVNVFGRPVKAGGAVFVASVSFTDEHDEAFGSGTGLFMVAPDPNVLMPEGPHPVDFMHVAGGPLTQPLAERAGCERRGNGVAVLGRRDDGLNSAGTVNGGLLALAIEEASLSARPTATLASMSIRFLRAVRVGPAMATATTHGDVSEVMVVDEGRDGALAIVATTRTFGL